MDSILFYKIEFLAFLCKISNLSEELEDYKEEIRIVLQSVMDFSKEVQKNELKNLNVLHK
jgi:hypothetical protein